MYEWAAPAVVAAMTPWQAAFYISGGGYGRRGGSADKGGNVPRGTFIGNYPRFPGKTVGHFASMEEYRKFKQGM